MFEHPEYVAQDLLQLLTTAVGPTAIRESAEVGSDIFWAKARLFVEFDPPFMGFPNDRDAFEIANLIVSDKINRVKIADLAPRFPQLPTRRFNSALNYLEVREIVGAVHTCFGSPWAMYQINVTDETLRFVRNYR